MKSITVCVIVCAIALNLSLICAKPQGPQNDILALPDESGRNFFLDNLSAVLHQQYNRLIDRINATWLSCNETYPVKDDERRVDLFSNANTNEVDPYVKATRKCLVDCVLRKMQLMTDNGLDDVRYITHIKILRLNYTVDMNEKSAYQQEKIYDAIKLHEVPILVERDSCYSSSIDRNTANMNLYAKTCSRLVESYQQAAGECRDLIDPLGEKCESAWMIQSCMIESHRQRGFESPFYPIYPEPMRQTPLRL